MASDTAPRLLDLTAGGQYIGVSRSRMYQLVKAGEIRSVHIGKLHKVAVAELDEYIARRMDAEQDNERD